MSGKDQLYPPEKDRFGDRTPGASSQQAEPAPAPPAYEEQSSSTAPAYDEQAPERAPAPEKGPRATSSMPTVESPFNFPSNADLPAYAPPSLPPGDENRKPIAIPQRQPDGSSPLVQAYSPFLLQRGVTRETWRSFLDTSSAFLAAKVSDRAISHAADIGRHFGEGPANLGKDISNQAKAFGKDIARHAKRGNIIGAAAGIVGGAISLPLSATFGAVGTVLALPRTAVGAITKRPQTPQERAAAYAAVANEKWLHQRGLHAELLSTSQLAVLLELPVSTFLEPAKKTKEGDYASAQLSALEGHIAKLEVESDDDGTVRLDAKTLWFVVIQK